MVLSKSSFNNAKWASLGTFSQVAIQLATLVILARLLTPKEFGIASTATLIIQFLYIFSEFGIGTLVVQRKALDDQFIAAAYVLSCVIPLVISLFLILISPWIALWFKTPELKPVLVLYCLYLIINGVVAIHAALAQRQLHYRHLARVDMISYAFGYGLMSISLGWLGFSYWALVFGYISQVTLKYLLLEKSFRASHSHHSYQNTLNHWPEFIQFGIGQSLSRMGSYIAAQVDSFIVASRLGMSATGIYSRAHQLATMPANQLGSIFDKLIFPLLARQQDDVHASQRIYCSNLLAVTVLGVAASVVIWASGDLIVRIVLGKEWAEVALPLKILGLALPLRLIQHVSDPTARAFGSTYRRAWRQWLFAGLTAILSLWLNQFGLAAVACGVVISALVNAILMVGLCGQILECRIKTLLLCVAPATLMGLASYAVLAATPNWKIFGEFQSIFVGLLCSCGFLIFFIFLFRQRRFREQLF